MLDPGCHGGRHADTGGAREHGLGARLRAARTCSLLGWAGSSADAITGVAYEYRGGSTDYLALAALRLERACGSALALFRPGRLDRAGADVWIPWGLCAVAGRRFVPAGGPGRDASSDSRSTILYIWTCSAAEPDAVPERRPAPGLAAAATVQAAAWIPLRLVYA